MQLEEKAQHNRRNLKAFFGVISKYIEDITRRREDMNFIFEWLKQYFTNERSE